VVAAEPDALFVATLEAQDEERLVAIASLASFARGKAARGNHGSQRGHPPCGENADGAHRMDKQTSDVRRTVSCP
jgi:hypothetical protein